MATAIAGIPIGLRDVHIALMTSDAVPGGTAIYQVPVRLAGAMEAMVNPNASSASLFADDGPMEVASTLGEISMDLRLADLPLEAQALLFGHELVGGVLSKKSTDVPPWLAVGFRTLKSNGKYRYYWMLKGKALPIEHGGKTKGEGIDYQSSGVKLLFVKRDCDDRWETVADEDATDFTNAVKDNWFLAVDGTPDTTAPTVTSIVPADGATGIAVSASIVITFSEALAKSTIHSGNFFLIDKNGDPVATTLSVNAGGTVVTMQPTAALTAASKFNVIVSPNITDLKGNKMAATYAKDFTTA